MNLRTWPLHLLAWILVLPGSVLAQTQCEPAPIEPETVRGALLSALAVPEINRPGASNADNARRVVDRVRAVLGRGVGATFVLRCVPESVFSKSAGSSASNPAAPTLVEPASFTDMISVALSRVGVLGSDANAVTVNVNALAFWAARRTDVYSTPEEFRATSNIRRIAGSVTIGAEIPKEDIVGFSGFPGADELADAVGWDMSVRMYGERDPRGAAWSDLLNQAALHNQVTTQIVGVAGLLAAEAPNAPAGDPIGTVTPTFLLAILAAANADAEGALEEATDALARSWVVTLKSSGQHLTKTDEANRYAVSLLADRAGVLGALTLTLNATYSHSNHSQMPDAPAMEPLQPRRIDNLELAGGLTGTILQNVIQRGRGAALTVSAQTTLPLDGAYWTAPDMEPPSPLPDRQAEWSIGATLELPFGDSATIPLSLIFTNDPNALEERRFVEGRLGVSWDFDAVTKALKEIAGTD